MKKSYYLLLAGGVDRKGIVFNLTKILTDFSFNIEDSSMVLLRKTFSVIMLLSHDRAALPATFDARLKKFARTFSMTVDIRSVGPKEMEEHSARGGTFMISLSGADRPGIVRDITGTVARMGGNIVDLETKSSQKAARAAYFMLLEVVMPSGVSGSSLQRALMRAGKKLGVHISVQRVEREIL